MSGADLFIEKVRLYGEKPVLVDGAQVCSARQLTEEIDACARAFAPHIRAGMVVALLADYSLAAIAAFLALARLQAIVVPLATHHEEKRNECFSIMPPDYVVDVEDGHVVLKAGTWGKAAFPLLEKLRVQGMAGLVLFSSGSTGTPKAMLHNLDAFLAHFAARDEKRLTILAFLMFDHIGGLNTLLGGLAMGAQLVLTRSRDTDALGALIAARKVQVLPATPTFLNLLLLSGAAQRHDLSSLRLITYGTEPMPEGLLARLRAAFPRARLLQTFGTSETGIIQSRSEQSASTLLRLDDPNVDVKIVQGELYLRSRTQVLGYLNAANTCFDDEGWFHTGDMVEQQADGQIKIIGRRSEIINVGGEKVFPMEVEHVLMTHEAVADCQVYGLANPITGQCVAADIVLAAGAVRAEATRLIKQHCLARLQPYKVPARLVFVDAIGHGDRFKRLRHKG